MITVGRIKRRINSLHKDVVREYPKSSKSNRFRAGVFAAQLHLLAEIQKMKK